MVKNLLDELIEKPQREIAGSDSSSRFDYQRNWAFCEMLRRHMAEADYLVAFEFHDDTVFLSPSELPTSAEFFQIKTAKSLSPQKLADFTARPKHASSILGKMFANFDGIPFRLNRRQSIYLTSFICLKKGSIPRRYESYWEDARADVGVKLRSNVPCGIRRALNR